MTEASLIVRTEGQVTTLILNRPDKCNALNGELIETLGKAFVEAAQNDAIRLVILAGEGRHFCAGMDIEWMKNLAEDSFEQSREDARHLASLLMQIHSFNKPLLALAQGGTIGGGVGLLACADVVLAAEDAYFCFSEAKIGLVPAVVSPYVLAAIGARAAGRYFLTAERMEASEAKHLGLVHRLVPAGALENEGLELAQGLLKNSPAALLETKRLLRLVANQEISLELSEKTAEIFAKMRVSEEAREGLKAFLEKRPPAWQSGEKA